MSDVAALGIKIEGGPSIDAASASLDRLVRAAEALERASVNMTSGVKKADAALEDSRKGYERLRSSVDASFSSSIRLRDATKELDKALKGGIISSKEHAETLALYAKQAENAGRSSSALEKAAYRMGAAVGAALGAAALRKYADEWSDMQSTVGAAIKDMDAAPAMMKRIVDIANASYSPLSQTASLYARNVGTLAAMGRSSREAADYTESLNNMLVITATRGERAASVQDALSKAMAVGKLQADGLETVLANGGRVAEELATSLGTTVNGLRDMATQGKITSQVISGALIDGLQKSREEAAKMPATITDAFTRLQTNMTEFVGKMDQASGASAAIAERILGFADNLRKAGDYIIGMGAKIAPVMNQISHAMQPIMDQADTIGVALAAMASVAVIGGIKALTVAIAVGLAGALKAVFALMAANPIGLFIGAIAGATYAVFKFRDDLTQALGTDIVDNVKRSINAVIGAVVFGVEYMGTLWDNFGALIGNAVINGVNTAITAVNGLITKTVERLNTMIALANLVNPFGNISSIAQPKGLGLIENQYADQAAAALKKVQESSAAAFSKDYVGAATDYAKALFSVADAANAAAGDEEGGGGKAGLKGMTKAEKALAEEFAKTVKELKEKITTEQIALDLLQEYGAAAKAMTEIDRDVFRAEKELAQAKGATAKQRATAILDLAKERQQIERATAAIDLQVEGQKKSVEERAKMVSEMEKTTQSLADGNKGMREEIELIGKSEAAQVEILQARELNIIAVKEQHAAELMRAADATGTMSRELIALQQEIEARRELVGLMGERSSRKAIADAAKKAAEEWTKTAEKINDTLTDALMRGFESGKDFAKNLRDTVVNMFQTMVLRPVISAVLSPISMGLAGGLGMSGNANAAMSGLSGFNSLGSIVPGIGSLTGAMSGFTTALTASMQSLAGITGTTSQMVASLAAAGHTAAPGIAAGVNAFGAIPGWGWALAGVAMLGSMFSKKQTLHSGAGAIYSGGNTQEGAGIYNLANFGMGDVREYNAGQQSLASGIASGLGTTLDGLAKAFGQKAGYEIATAFADDTSKDGAWGSFRVTLDGADLLNWEDTRSSRWAPREFADGEQGQKEYLAMIANDTRALIAGLVPEWGAVMLKSLGDSADMERLAAVVSQIGMAQQAFVGFGQFMPTFANLADSALVKLMEASGGVEALSANMSSFVANFFTEEERLAVATKNVTEALAELGFAMPATREEYKALVQAQWALGDAGAATAAQLLGLSGAFAQVVQFTEEVEQATTSVADAMKAAAAAASTLAGRVSSSSASRDTAGGLLDSIAGAAGYNGEGYARMREARLWEQMVVAPWEKQIELADELTGIVLSRYQMEKQAADEQMALARGLRDYVNSLTTGSLSPLTLREKLAEAERQAYSTYNAAVGGDKTAQGQLQDRANTYLELARQYYASNDEYTKIFNTVTQALTGFGNSLEVNAQKDVAGQTLDQMRELYKVLDSVYQMADADAAVQSGLLTDQLTVLAAMEGGLAEVIRILGGMPADLTVSLGREVLAKTAQNYVDLMGQVGLQNSVGSVIQLIDTATPEGLAQSYAGSMAALQTADQAAKLDAIWAAVKQYRGIDGSHAMGLSNVPFDGYIAELHRGERVLTARENQVYTPDFSSFGRGNGMTAMAEEIKALRAEVSSLRRENREDAQGQIAATVGSSQMNAQAIVQGVTESAERAEQGRKIESKAGYK